MESAAGLLGSASGDMSSLFVSVLVFAIVFVAVLGLGRRFLRPRGVVGEAPSAGPGARSGDPRRELRSTLHGIFRILAVVMLLAMVGLTIGSYFGTDAGDGSRMLTIVLGGATLVFAFYLHRIDRRLRPLRPGEGLDPAMVGDWRSLVGQGFGVRSLGPATLEWSIASPDVHTMDQATLDRARAMAADGTGMDEICRTLAADYDQWSMPHRQAFQAVVKAAIEHGNSNAPSP